MRWFILTLFIVFPAISQAMDPSKVDMQGSVAEMSKRADEALKNYSPQNAVQTGQVFSRMYFDVFEGAGMEFALGIYDKSAMLSIESQFSKVMGLSMDGAPKDKLSAEWKILETKMKMAADKHQDKHEGGFWSMFLQSLLILLREGFEAILVVTALVTYLRRSGAGDKVHVIWKGVGLALVASLVTVWLLNYVIEASGSSREAMEGITMLVATVVLVYVSYWLFAKREAEKWQSFIRSKIDSAVSTGSLFMLGFAAFLAVYREGAETILFYQALTAGSGEDLTPVIAGFAVACVGLVAIFFIMRTASVRLPLGLFFSVTAVFLFVMSFIFLGKGILELQIAGWIKSTAIEGFPQISALGVFPSIQSFGAQMALLIVTALLFVFMIFRKKTAPVEAG